MEVLMIEDIFKILLDILDELRMCRLLISPGDPEEEIIVAEWRAVARVADRFALIVFASINIGFFFVVFFILPKMNLQ